MNLNKEIKYYLSGPNYIDNFQSYKSLSNLLRSKGFAVTNPVENYEPLSEHGAVIMMQGWEESFAARNELDCAVKFCMLVICESDLYTHNVIGRIAVESES